MLAKVLKGDVPEVLEALPKVPKGLALVVAGALEVAPNAFPIVLLAVDEG